MPVEPILDVSSIDFSRPMFSRADIERVNPHRGVMALLDAVVWVDEGNQNGVAVKHVRGDEFWASGHIPGLPIFPGVLMVESAAQLCSFLYYRRTPTTYFAGFTRIENTVFRGVVTPGDTLQLLAAEIKYNPKRFVTHVQGMVGDDVVFEGKITGMMFPNLGEITLQSVADGRVAAQ